MGVPAALILVFTIVFIVPCIIGVCVVKIGPKLRIRYLSKMHQYYQREKYSFTAMYDLALKNNELKKARDMVKKNIKYCKLSFAKPCCPDCRNCTIQQEYENGVPDIPLEDYD